MLLQYLRYNVFMYYSQEDIKKLGTILGVWAHPDDEIFSCAGLMHAAVLNNQNVISVTATYGDAGESADEARWPKSELSKIRKAESEKANEIIGGAEQHWLEYKDGQLKNVKTKEAVDKIISTIGKKKIDTIVTFETEGITGHEDHKTVHKWSLKLAEKIGIKNVLCAVESQEFYDSHGRELDAKHNIYFNIDKPNCVCKSDADVCLELPKEFRLVKHKALQAHASQTSEILASNEGLEAIDAMCECECYVFAKV